jgi:hypothetical protein
LLALKEEGWKYELIAEKFNEKHHEFASWCAVRDRLKRLAQKRKNAPEGQENKQISKLQKTIMQNKNVGKIALLSEDKKPLDVADVPANSVQMKLANTVTDSLKQVDVNFASDFILSFVPFFVSGLSMNFENFEDFRSKIDSNLNSNIYACLRSYLLNDKNTSAKTFTCTDDFCKDFAMQFTKKFVTRDLFKDIEKAPRDYAICYFSTTLSLALSSALNSFNLTDSIH